MKGVLTRRPPVCQICIDPPSAGDMQRETIHKSHATSAQPGRKGKKGTSARQPLGSGAGCTTSLSVYCYSGGPRGGRAFATLPPLGADDVDRLPSLPSPQTTRATAARQT